MKSIDLVSKVNKLFEGQIFELQLPLEGGVVGKNYSDKSTRFNRLQSFGYL